MCVCVTFLVTVSLADPDAAKRPARPQHFKTPDQIRQYLQELQSFVAQNPTSRYFIIMNYDMYTIDEVSPPPKLRLWAAQAWVIKNFRRSNIFQCNKIQKIIHYIIQFSHLRRSYWPLGLQPLPPIRELTSLMMVVYTFIKTIF